MFRRHTHLRIGQACVAWEVPTRMYPTCGQAYAMFMHTSAMQMSACRENPQCFSCYDRANRRSNDFTSMCKYQCCTSEHNSSKWRVSDCFILATCLATLDATNFKHPKVWNAPMAWTYPHNEQVQPLYCVPPLNIRIKSLPDCFNLCLSLPNWCHWWA